MGPAPRGAGFHKLYYKGDYIPIPGWIDAKEPNLAGDSHRMSTYVVNYSAHS
jgi:hypothetical protein